MSRMKIVLRETVDNLGDAGDLVVVSGGYARNFLIPRGLAVPATKGTVKQADDFRASQAARTAKVRTDAEALAATLRAQPVRVSAKAGPEGQLFGSVTASDIAAAIERQFGASIDRHTIELEEPIRHVGVHEVRIPLHAEVTAEVTVEVEAAS